MTLQTIASIAEIVGAIVVVITLIYLTVQLRQNNALLRSQSRQAQLSSDQSSILLGFEHAGLLQKMNSAEPLTAEEQMKLNFIYALDMRNREFEYFQYREGLLDESAWNSFREIIVMNHATRKGRAWWEKIGRTLFDPEFVDDVDALLEGVEDDDRMAAMAKWDS
jgi:hypothetical protein